MKTGPKVPNFHPQITLIQHDIRVIWGEKSVRLRAITQQQDRSLITTDLLDLPQATKQNGNAAIYSRRTGVDSIKTGLR